MSVYNFISFLGIFVLLAVAWLFSSNKRNINFRVIVWGIGLQLLFDTFVFLLPDGAKFFLYLNGIVVIVLNSASAGAEFVFGRLALPPGRLTVRESSHSVFFRISGFSHDYLFFRFSLHTLLLQYNTACN